MIVLEGDETMTDEERRNDNRSSFFSRNYLSFLPRIFIIIGIILIAFSVATGGAEVALLFIIPFVVGTDAYSTLGILFIIIAFFLWFFLPFRELERSSGGGVAGEGEQRQLVS